MTEYRTLTVRRVAGALGGEVQGIDLRQPLSPEQSADIRRAWNDHLVLFFRDQALTSDQYMAFARTLGTPVEYPFVKGMTDHPQIIEVKKELRGAV